MSTGYKPVELSTKDEKLSKILDKRKGYRDKVLKEKMDEEYEKFMKKYM